MRVKLLVVRWISDFEVLNGQAGHIIHRYLEVHRDRPDLLAALGGRRLAQGDLGDEGVLVAALELFDRPFGHLFVLLILEGLALHALGELK